MRDLELIRALFAGESEEGTPRLSFVVVGHPEPAGSKRIVAAGGRPRIVDDNPKSSAWKRRVRLTAESVRALVGYPILEGPVAIRARFVLLRPSSVTRPYPTVRPDATKLLRGTEDALTGVLFKDDGQIVEQFVAKVYGPFEGVEIAVWPLIVRR